MSFAIEVPGAASPLSIQSLCQTLQAANSPDGSKRQAAGQQLQTWESQAGYFSSLQAVYLDKSLPHDVRYLAVIQLKNGIDKYWRLYAHVKNGIQANEKEAIRARLFEGTIQEENHTLALHNALVVSKVVRVDFPADWPDALPSIIGLLRSLKTGNQHELRGALEIMLRVTKELSTARMKKSQTALQSVTPEAVFVLAEIFTEKLAQWTSYLTSGGQGSEDEAMLSMANSLAALKVLRRLVTRGYERPHGNDTVQQFWTLSQSQFQPLINLISEESTVPAQYQELVGKHLLQFTKLHNDMAELHAASFVFLPNSLPLVEGYWSLVAKFAAEFSKSDGIRQENGNNGNKPRREGSLSERLALKGLLLLRSCVRIAFQPVQTFKYRTPETKAEQEQARSRVATDLFKPDLVVQIVNTIITHLFVFRESDLERWEEDPEEWEQQQQSEGDAYEWEVRPCAEKLFLDLLTHFKQLLTPPLLEYFESARSEEASIATKEAVYTALGLAAAHVFNVYDFNAMLTTTISQDAQKQGGHYKVLRRRIAILISQWAPVRLEETGRPVAYQIFWRFLDPRDETNDAVVKITAARQLRWLADELDFNTAAFSPYAADVLIQLIELIQNVDVDETKLAVLESLRILVTRMEENVSQFGDQIMNALPQVWENSAKDDFMIKQAVIAIFSALVMSMGTESQRYHHFMIPLLSETANYGSELHLPLIDESLQLWNSLLMQSKPPLAREIVDLLQLALPLLEYHVETATQALSALESYILLAPAAVLEEWLRRPTILGLTGTLKSKSREQVRLGTACIEYLIQAAVRGPETNPKPVFRDLVEIGFIKKMLEELHDSWEARQTTGPNRKVSNLNPVTEGDYLAILSRLVLASPDMFMEMLASFGDLTQVWAWLSAEWFAYQRDMDQPERQKLYLLALTRLLELPAPVQELCLSRLQDYFDMWTSVITELHDGDLSGQEVLNWGVAEDTDYDTPKSVAEREVLGLDPVHSERTLEFVRVRLEHLVQGVGNDVFEQWAANVDRDLLGRFQEMANGRR